MKRLLLLLALLFCHGNAEAQRVETYFLKGFPIGQPRVNLLPRESNKCKRVTPLMITQNGITDSTQIGMYNGIQDDSLAYSGSVYIWKSAWFPVFGATQVVVHATHAGTDSGLIFVAGNMDTVTTDPSVQDFTTTGSIQYLTGGSPATTVSPQSGVYARGNLNVPIPSGSTVTRGISGDPDAVWTLLPFWRNSAVEIVKTINSRYMRVMIRSARIANAINSFGSVGPVRVWAEVFYSGDEIPTDWVYDTYKGAVAQ